MCEITKALLHNTIGSEYMRRGGEGGFLRRERRQIEGSHTHTLGGEGDDFDSNTIWTRKKKLSKQGQKEYFDGEKVCACI